MTSAGGDWLATGGADETIRVYNLRKKRDMGALHSHAGAVTCLEFFGKQHLLSGSDDGTLRIWRVSDWACLHVLGGHKSGVTSIAIHPTGRLALSTSSDKTVRLWNLMEGRNAYISRLTSLPIPEKVQFSLCGLYYGLLFRNQILVYSVSTGEITSDLEHERARLSDFCYIGNNYIVTGADDGKLRLWNTLLDEGTMIREYDCGMGSKERIKGLERIDGDRVAALFSSGLVQIWDYHVPKNGEKTDGENGENDDGEQSDDDVVVESMSRVCSLTRVAKTGSRATCLASCTSEGSGTLRVSNRIAATGDADVSHGGIVNKEKEKIKMKKAARKLVGGADGGDGGKKKEKGGKILNDYLARKKLPKKIRKNERRTEKKKLEKYGDDHDKEDKKRKRIAQHQPWKLKNGLSGGGNDDEHYQNKYGGRKKKKVKNDSEQVKAKPFNQKIPRGNSGKKEKKKRRHRGAQ